MDACSYYWHYLSRWQAHFLSSQLRLVATSPQQLPQTSLVHFEWQAYCCAIEANFDCRVYFPLSWRTSRWWWLSVTFWCLLSCFGAGEDSLNFSAQPFLAFPISCLPWSNSRKCFVEWLMKVFLLLDLIYFRASIYLSCPSIRFCWRPSDRFVCLTWSAYSWFLPWIWVGFEASLVCLSWWM